MKTIKKAVTAVVAVLMILFLVLSSSSLLSRNTEKEIKKISVIGIKRDSNQVDDFRRGIEEAANLYRVDIEYLEFSEEDMEIEEYIERECEAGAEALIVFSEKEDAVLSYLQKNKRKIPLIMVGEENVSDHALHVWYESKDMAEELAEKVQEQQAKEVVFLTDGRKSSQKAKESLLEALVQRGITMEEKKLTAKNIEAYQKEEKVFVCASPEIMEEAAEHFQEENHTIYGIGYSDKVIRLIKDGKIDGTAAYNGYVLGIYAVQAAQATIDNKKVSGNIKADCRWIDQKNVESEYEFLFPIY